ncbi:hypothetical protein PybrP1_003362 [[Pythium] brassicae (nom. inval.)]|nr:hypothetical protein PybrP1_003362 [[Pythium] brassicae (nom. inval.)]
MAPALTSSRAGVSPLSSSSYVSVCDFFAYEATCVLAVSVSWTWCIWVMCLDAVPPVVRRKLGLRNAVPIAVVIVVLEASGALAFLLFFSNGCIGKNPRDVGDQSPRVASAVPPRADLLQQLRGGVRARALTTRSATTAERDTAARRRGRVRQLPADCVEPELTPLEIPRACLDSEVRVRSPSTQ